ncbi:MAG: response regulator [Candidatus Omnitrophota bacterium]
MTRPEIGVFSGEKGGSMTAEEKKRILIVEDDPNMCVFYKDMFRAREDRYEIEIVNDARIAFRKITDELFDLIILDMIMEPMDGEMFFLCVRETSRIKDIPVLIVSVLSPGTMEHLKKIDHVEFMQKPISPEDLYQKVDMALKAL